MAKVDFSKIAFNGQPQDSSYEGWLARLEKETGKSAADLYERTMEQIDIKPLYTEADYQGMSHLHYMAGIPPYLRGPYPTWGRPPSSWKRLKRRRCW